MDDDDHMSFGDEEDYGYSSDDLQDPEVEESDLKQSSSRKPTSHVITKESLVAAQKENLDRAMELLLVKESQARTLLIYYRWNFDKLFDVFVDSGKESMLNLAGITVFDPSLMNSGHASKKTTRMSCDICIEDGIPSHAMTRMECGHSFCNDCWKEHFTVRINDGESKRIKCMAHKCNAICDEGVVRKLVSPELAEKFDRFLFESYVEDSDRIKWCPSVPHCGNAIRKEDGEGEVECSCGLQFCFGCLGEAHSPCSCLMWKLWSKKCADESETVNWITVNTKLCPKCIKPVHRISGCNLMTCICGQHFCWLCGGATGVDHTWTSIRGHSCGRYNDEQARQLLERAKRDLNRYTHYYHQYKAHTDSVKKDDELRKSILKKAVSNSKTKKNHAVFNDYNWVIKGMDLLFRSRRILSYSYPFVFYMFGEELFKDEMSEKDRELKKVLFEDQQEQFKSDIEKLSEALGKPFDEFDDAQVSKMKKEINDLGNAVDAKCKRMYECIDKDLLGPSSFGFQHKIAPYRSEGIEKAIVFSDSGLSGGEDF
ncbi:unnamed protein product [Microthlaspi erraticum]|uniref:RBR-type E3 ubiquitin transferase n=1 Tax=Microthlaspi erraticum TaxID=1685480 RepID=A0A6D2K038_9BRAS|nr:unnamed protein product [Microthlaspi erraticum]